LLALAQRVTLLSQQLHDPLASLLTQSQQLLTTIRGAGLDDRAETLAGHAAEAMTVLKDGLKRHPDDRAILGALVSFSRDAGDFATALQYAERLAAITPDNREIAELIESLRRAAKKPDGR